MTLESIRDIIEDVWDAADTTALHNAKRGGDTPEQYAERRRWVVDRALDLIGAELIIQSYCQDGVLHGFEPAQPPPCALEPIDCEHLHTACHCPHRAWCDAHPGECGFDEEA